MSAISRKVTSTNNTGKLNLRYFSDSRTAGGSHRQNLIHRFNVLHTGTTGCISRIVTRNGLLAHVHSAVNIQRMARHIARIL
jgi:hypothetical protein